MRTEARTEYVSPNFYINSRDYFNEEVLVDENNFILTKIKVNPFSKVSVEDVRVEGNGIRSEGIGFVPLQTLKDLNGNISKKSIFEIREYVINSRRELIDSCKKLGRKFLLKKYITTTIDGSNVTVRFEDIHPREHSVEKGQFIFYLNDLIRNNFGVVVI